MKIFISWSKEPSKQVAEALKVWLPEVIQVLKPWVSTGIAAGSRWNNTIASQLETAKFGIICVTPTNQREPWLQFEAGALAKTLNDQTYVSPYLINFDGERLVESPLTAFQNVSADEKGTFGLLKSINKALTENQFESLSSEALKKSFDKSWPDLDAELKKIATSQPKGNKESPNPNEMISEILETVRQLSRDSSGVSLTWGRVTEASTKQISKRRKLKPRGVDAGILMMAGPGSRVYMAVEMIESVAAENIDKISTRQEATTILDNGDLSTILNFYVAEGITNAFILFKQKVTTMLDTLGLEFDFLDPD